jgi:hypothetical protein
MVEACPIYQGKQDKVPHERTVAGTIAHDMTDSGKDDQRLSDDDALAAAECMDFLARRKQLMEEARSRFVLEEATRRAKIKPDDPEAAEKWGKDMLPVVDAEVPQVKELTELKVAIDDKPIQLPMFDNAAKEWTIVKLPTTTSGYFDRALIAHDGKRAEMFDWKFGMWPVEEAKNNVQGIAYVLGFFRQHPKLEQVEMFFKQPHLNLITSATFRQEDLPLLKLRIKTIVERAIHFRALAAKGDWQGARPFDPVCTFCLHIGRCPKVADFCCKIAHKFFPIEIPAQIDPLLVTTTKDASLLLRCARVAKVWSDAAKQVTTDRCLRGDAKLPDGYTIQTRAGNRKIADLPKFKEVALRYLTEEELKQCEKYILGEVESLIKEKAPRGQKTIQVKEFQKIVEGNDSIKRDDSYSFLRAAASKESVK